MGIVLGLLAIAIVFALSYLISNDRKNINYKGIIIMLILEIVITWFMFSTQIGSMIINGIS